MSILNDIWNRIARKPDRQKAAATETSGTENRVYAVVTEEGVILFSDTPKGMKARNSYLQQRTTTSVPFFFTSISYSFSPTSSR